MSDEKTGKWRPFNQDGSEHDCKKQNEKLTNGHNGNGNDISVEVLLRKLASIGITIDLELVRNVK